MEAYIDIHTHILPGVDDGAGDMETAEQMLLQAKENGVESIILTSHYCPFRWRWDKNRYLENFAVLQEKGREMGICLYPGNEIYYTSHIQKALEEEKCMTLNGSRYLLVEFPYDVWKQDLENAVMSLRYEGYFPVIAHAERYHCLEKSADTVEGLIEQGVYIQVNCESVIRGHRGILKRSAVRQWLKQGLVHVVATDTHDTGKRPNQMRQCAEVLEKYYGADTVRRLLIYNPGQIIRDQYIGDE